MKVFTIRYKPPAFPFLPTCSLLFPLLAMLVGWLTHYTSSSSKTQKLSVTDADGNQKEKERHPLINSPLCLYQKLPSSLLVYSLLLLSPDLCPFFLLFLQTRVPILIFFDGVPSPDPILTFFVVLSLTSFHKKA